MNDEIQTLFETENAKIVAEKDQVFKIYKNKLSFFTEKDITTKLESLRIHDGICLPLFFDTFSVMPRYHMDYLDYLKIAHGKHDLLTNKGISELCHKLKPLFLQLTNSLDLIHSKNIVHKDIKPDNILINVDFKNDIVKSAITDFGLSSESGDKSSAGSFGYLAPESFIADFSKTTALDIWSFGVLIFKSVTAGTIFKDDEDMESVCQEHLRSAIQGFYMSVYNYHSYLPSCVYKTICSCLQVLPDDRPSAKELNLNIQAWTC